MQTIISLVYAISIILLCGDVNAAPQMLQAVNECPADRTVRLCCPSKDAKDENGNLITPIPLIKDLSAVLPSIGFCLLPLGGGCNENAFDMCCEKSQIAAVGEKDGPKTLIPGFYEGKNCKPLRQD